MTFDVPLRFKGGEMKFSNTVVFNGRVTIDDEGAVSLNWPSPRSTSSIKSVTFNNEIYGPKASAIIVPGNGGYGSRLDFNGPLTLRELWNNGAYITGKPQTYFNATGNHIGTFHFMYNHQIYFPTANAFDEDLVIEDVSDKPELGMISFQSDQVIDRFTAKSGILANHSCRYRGNASTMSTVTMRASADTAIYNAFENKLSLVWDPKGDYTFTLGYHFASATNTMNGTIEVKGGAFAIKDDTYFTALSGITVRNGGTFSLAASTAAQPIPTTCTLVVDEGGQINVPAGMTLRVGNVIAGGSSLTVAGTYTKDHCAWITGEGAVVYNPVMESVGSLAMNESLHEQTKCWTNTVLGLCVVPKAAEATNFDYLVVSELRTPQGTGTYTYHGRRLTVGEVGGRTGKLTECSFQGVVTNIIGNEGLFLANGGITFNGGRYGKSTWTGKTTILSPQGNEVSFVGGNASDPLISQLFLSGTLFGAADVGMKAGGGQLADVTGQRITFDADASQYYGQLKAFGANGWVSLGNTIFNGAVVCKEGCAFGTELATDTAQVKDLTFSEATPFVVPVAAASDSEGTAGLVVVTNSFTQSAKVTVYHRGRMWYGRTPVLKLAPGCTGTLDPSQFEFGGYMTKYRVADASDKKENWPGTLKLEVGTDPVDGGRVLYLAAAPRGTMLLFR